MGGRYWQIVTYAFGAQLISSTLFQVDKPKQAWGIANMSITPPCTFYRSKTARCDQMIKCSILPQSCNVRKTTPTLILLKHIHIAAIGNPFVCIDNSRIKHIERNLVTYTNDFVFFHTGSKRTIPGQ